jgi:SAM-dependent methyltransferase
METALRSPPKPLIEWSPDFLRPVLNPSGLRGGKSPCPLCGANEFRHFLTGFDRVFPGLEHYDYDRCDRCGLVYMNPPPNDERIVRFYAKGYAPHLRFDPSRFDRRFRRLVNRFVVRYHLAPSCRELSRGVGNRVLRFAAKFLGRFVMKHHLAPHGEKRLLDVGCGNGGWLYRHARLGWRAEGVEISPEACRQARSLGLSVHEGTLFDLPDTPRFDVICLHHLIEHVADPVGTLEKAGRLLAPNGRIVIRLPNLDSYGFRRFGLLWFPLEPPRHLFQFTPRTVRRLVARSRLRLLSLRTESNPCYLWKSRLYEQYLGRQFGEIGDPAARREKIRKCRERERKSRLLKTLCKKWFSIRTLFMNRRHRGETMRVVLEKPADPRRS